METLNYLGNCAGADIRCWGDSAMGGIEVPSTRSQNAFGALVWLGIVTLLLAAPAIWLNEFLPASFPRMDVIAIVLGVLLLVLARRLSRLLSSRGASTRIEWSPNNAGGGVRLKIVPGADGATTAAEFDLAVSEVTDIAVGFAAQRVGGLSKMSMLLRPLEGPALRLLADRPPADLLRVTDLLREVVGLPTRREAREAWLVRMSSCRVVLTSDPVSSVLRVLPAWESAAPVLSYAGGRVAAPPAGRVDCQPDRMVIELSSDEKSSPTTVITLDAGRLSIDGPGGQGQWSCDDVFGVFGGAVLHERPPVLVVGSAQGIRSFFIQSAEKEIERAADLLNEALHIANGSRRSRFD